MGKGGDPAQHGTFNFTERIVTIGSVHVRLAGTVLHQI